MSIRRALRSRGESFALVTARELTPDDRRVPVSAAAAAAMLAPLLTSSLDVMELRRVAAQLGPALPPSDDREVLARLVTAIGAGRLILVRVDPPQSWGYGVTRPRADRPDAKESGSARPVEDTTHWVELRLVDEDDAVVAGQRYLVVTPDGRQHRGYTDSLGEARVTRLPPGPYQVSFPDLDAGACERTGAS